MSLFGFHVFQGVPGDELPGRAATELLGTQGYSESAVTSALHRLRRDGVLTTRRHGRVASHRLTETGIRDLRAGARLEQVDPPPLPDDEWVMVVARVDDGRRARLLRERLDLFAFGTLVPGVRVHRIDWRSEIEPAIERHAPGQAHCLRFRPSTDAHEFASTVWDLAGLARRWRTWLDQHHHLTEGTASGPRDAYERLHRLVDAYTGQAIPDPRLPDELLTDHEPSRRARKAYVDQAWRLYEDAHAHAVEVLERHRVPA